MRRLRLLALACLAPLSTARAADKPYQAAVSIVLDASKGAAALAGTRTLYELELAAVTKVLEAMAVPEGGEVVVRTMGGEAGARCEATRPLVPPGVTPGPVLRTDGARIRPSGPRPLSTALDGAASDLGGLATGRAVILLTTGGDACGRDVCAVARELRRDPGLGTVRVVGVGGELSKALSCLGPVHVAKTQEALEAQLRDALEAAFVPAQLVVEATDEGKPAGADIELFPAGDEVPVARGRSGTAFALAGGTYDVRVATAGDDGAMLREGWRRGVELAAATRVSLRVALGKGPGRLVVRVRLNGVTAPEGTRLFLHPPGDRTTEVASGWPDEPLVASPGRYDVRATIPGSAFGDIEVWRAGVSLEAGVTAEVTLDARQKMGAVRVQAASGGEPVDEAVLMVLSNGARGDSDNTIAGGDEARLPAGTYTLAARLETPGGAVVGYRDGVKVVPDGLAQVTVEMGPCGTLEVEVGGDDSGLWNVGLVRPGETRPSGWLETGTAYRVPAGRYDLRLERQAGVRTLLQRGVVVAPGEHKHVVVKGR